MRVDKRILGAIRRCGRGLVASVLVAAVVVPVVHVSATPVATTVAGTGTDGPLVNGIDPLTAQLWGPSDVAVGPDGTVYIADTYHHQIRKIGADGLIQPFLGTGNPGCGPSGDTGLVQPRGLAVDAAGNVYVSNTLCSLVEMIAPDGTVSIVAGQYNPNGWYNANIPEGAPATSVWLNQPAGLDYDNATNTLYIADQYSSRVLKVAGGLIYKVAGTGYNGFTGDGPATANQLNSPRDVYARNGNVYIADSSNCRVRKVDAVGNMTTIIGTGSCNDWGDTGPGTLAAITSANGLAMDAQGVLYISSGTSGQIRKLGTDGNIQAVVGLPGGQGGISFDTHGDLLVAGMASQKVVKISGLAPPVPAPQIADINVKRPALSDQMLKAGIEFTVQTNGTDVAYYQYGWAKDAAATAPTTTLQTAGNVNAFLDYSETTPDSTWYLLARAVTSTDVKGSWFTKEVKTPKAPLVIAMGDSITAGHHLLSTDSETVCQDETYGYPQQFVYRLQASLPAQWAPAYTNHAHSGFSVVHETNVTTGSVVDGGPDACQVAKASGSWPSEVSDVTQDLRDNQGSWNRVVTTMGINDTNWADVMKVIVTNPFLAYDTGQSAIGVMLKQLQPALCSATMRLTWNGYRTAMQQNISGGISTVISKLREADPAVTIDVQSYYNMAGVFPLTSGCKGAIDNAVATMQTTIKAGIGTTSGVRFNNVGSVMNSNSANIQSPLNNLTAPNAIMLTGWPHPNSDGAAAIAGLIPLGQ